MIICSQGSSTTEDIQSQNTPLVGQEDSSKAEPPQEDKGGDANAAEGTKAPTKNELKKRAKEEEKARKAEERRVREEEAARAKAAEEEANVSSRI